MADVKTGWDLILRTVRGKVDELKNSVREQEFHLSIINAVAPLYQASGRPYLADSPERAAGYLLTLQENLARWQEALRVAEAACFATSSAAEAAAEVMDHPTVEQWEGADDAPVPLGANERCTSTVRYLGESFGCTRPVRHGGNHAGRDRNGVLRVWSDECVDENTL